jgi:hypothetical protein
LSLLNNQSTGIFAHMNAILDLLEAIDRITFLPLLLMLLLAAISGWLVFNIYKSHQLQEGSSMTRGNSSTNTSSLLSSVQDLRQQWDGNRNYHTVIMNGAVRSGTFQGWFDDERKICQEFKGKINQIKESKERYPKTEEDYLKIVDEIDRKNKPWWIWALLAVLMIAEAYGFSILLAGYLNDSGSAAQDSNLALGLSVLISVVGLGAAYFVGAYMYKHSYAWRVWKGSGHQIRRELDAAGGGTVRTGATLGLSTEDNAKDANRPQEVRMANRSQYVADLAAATSGSAAQNKVAKYNNYFWIYSAVVLLFGIFVVTVRISAINDSFSKEVQRLQTIESVDKTTLTKPSQSGNSGSLLQSLQEQSKESENAASADALEKTRSTKQVVTFVYFILFLAVQAVAVIFTQRYGFASEEGENAYKKLKEFKEKNGATLSEEFEAKQKSDLAQASEEATALAQSTLINWQIGLQTEYREGSATIDFNQRNAIQAAIDGSSDRTYSRYLLLEEQQNNTPLPPVVRTPASSVVISTPTDIPTPSVQVTPSGLFSKPLDAPAIVTAIPLSETVEYFIRSTNGNESIVSSALLDLKAQVADGELDANSLMLRTAGQPGAYMAYRDFIKSLKA